MDRDPNQQKMSYTDQARCGLNIVYALGSALAMAVLPITHSGFGVYALAPGAYSLIWLLAFAMATDSPAMLAYIGVWLIFVIWRRITADPDQHSRYPGCPWWRLPYIKTEEQTKRAEPGLLMLLGMFIGPFSPPLGFFLMISGCGVAVKEGIDREVIVREDRAVRDAEIQMRSRMGRFRR